MDYTTFRIYAGIVYLVLTVLALIQGIKLVKTSFKSLTEQLDEQEKRKASDESELKNRKSQLDH